MKSTSRFALLYGLIAVTLLWEALHLMAHSPALPSPVACMINLLHLVTADHLFTHLFYSLLRLLTALLLSLFIGGTLGLLLGLHPRLDQLASPLLYVLFPMPKAALLPVLFLFFGLGELTKILLLFLILVFQIVLMTRDTVKNLPENIFLSARALGLSRAELYRHVLLPAMAKPLLSSLRIGIGTGIAVLFFAENYATENGIGFFIMNSWSLINYLDMYSGILAMSLMGALMFALLDFLEKRYCSWAT